jgi:hypothetical protein
LRALEAPRATSIEQMGSAWARVAWFLSCEQAMAHYSVMTPEREGPNLAIDEVFTPALKRQAGVRTNRA